MLTMKAIGLISSLALLATFASAVEIQCDFIYVHFGVDIEFLYTCDVTGMTVENPTTVTSITGNHLTGRGNGDVKGFWVESRQILTIIPEDIEKFFANLEGFEWAHGNISSIDSSTFAAWPNLTYINLGSNNIVTLDGDLFTHTRKLRKIHFDRNMLAHVGHGLLTGLDDLTFAYFLSNPCISVSADTPQGIQDLNDRLPIHCPPLATTPDPPTTTISATSEPNECPASCASNEEAQAMRLRMDEIESRLRALE